jgi:hypothetical protein
MASSTQISNVVGAITAVLINVLLIALFVSRLAHRPKIEYWLGIVIILGLVPLSYLFITGVYARRPLLYFIQVGLMMAYLIVEVMVDYVLKIEFRQVRWLVIPYVTLFFAATGGMIGIASRAGKVWTIAAVLSFFAMTILSLVQRHITGQ